jgi:DNA ligase-1
MPLNVLDQIANVSGKNDKLQILKDNSNNKQLAELLDAVFNYNRRFWVNKFDMPPVTSSVPFLMAHSTFMNLLNDLESRKITGNAAKSVVEAFFAMCNKEQQEWYAKILRKDLKAGFSVKTAVKAGFKSIPVFDVMLAKDGKLCKKLDETIEAGVFVSPKLDGYRCLAVVVDGSVTLYSRNGTIYNNFPKITQSLIDCFPHGKHVFDGEIMSDDFQAMQQTAFAEKRGQTVGDVKYHVFGYVDYKEWTTQKFKMNTMSRLTELGLLAKKFDSNIIKVQQSFVDSKELVLKMERQYLTQGYEGAMALPDIPYYLGKKSNRLLKFKTMVSQDVIIKGFFEGKEGTDLEGNLGGFVVEQEDGIECRVGTMNGLQRADRQYIWDNQGEFLGKTFESKYQDIASQGKMRFPVFMRWRNDK